MKLIDDWRDAWRLWSVRLAALGALLQALALASPDALLAVWNGMPDDLRLLLPEGAARFVSLGLFLAGIIARLMRQDGKSSDADKDRQTVLADTSGRTTPKTAAAGGVAGVIAIALAMAVAALPADEGKRNVGYLDIARIPTNCFGHTGPEVRVGERKTDAECIALLSTDAETHMRGVLRRSPALGTRPYQLAAATRLAFNIGVAAYSGSTIARRFDAGDWRDGCDGFLAWNKARVNGRLVVVRGLQLRRERERAMCLTGL